MKKYYRQIIGSPVVTQVSGFAGRVHDLIIDPDNGKIVAFLLMGRHDKIVTPIDILEWGQNIAIHDYHDIIDIEDVLKVQKIVESQRPIAKQYVITKSGEKLGRVLDYEVETNFFQLTNLIVAKSFLGIFFWERKIIPLFEVIEVTSEHILVKDPAKPVKMKKFQIDMAPQKPQRSAPLARK